MERKLVRAGFWHIAGLDEAGRGAWAGPLAAAAVILPLDRKSLSRDLASVRDSKQMTALQRSAAAVLIREIAVAWAVGSATCTEVDSIGPLRATRLAMERALAGLSIPPDHLLIDYLQLPGRGLPQTALVHGDARCLTISAASVLAKVWRDEYMQALGSTYSAYGFDRHKGYGTRVHAAALSRHGPCPEHRLSYEPVREAGSPTEPFAV